MRAGADLRLLRAAVFAAVCTALAAAGHIGASCSVASSADPGVTPWAVAAGWAAVFTVAAPLAGRERHSLPAVATLLTIGQVLLHHLFSAGQHVGAGPHGHGGGHSGAHSGDHLVTGLSEAHARHIVSNPGTAAPSPPSPAHDDGASSLADALPTLATGPMVLGHLLAALVAGWLLLRGEAALWQLVRLSTHRSAAALPWLRALGQALRLVRRLYGGLLPCRPIAVSRPRTGHHATPATGGTALPDSVIRRGPPCRWHAAPIILAV